MKEIVYHGSENIIDKPEFGKGSLQNDYGRGFYCTKSPELAKEWACGKGNSGYANKYELNLTGLKVIDLNSEPYNILNWLAVLTKHRTYWQNSSISAEAKDYLQKNFYVDISQYDVVKGYRADDSYFTFAQDFVSGAISLQKLRTAMHLGELGEQIVLISPKAFSKIKYVGCEEAPANIYFEKKIERDQNARNAYRKDKGNPSSINDLFMLDIMREGIKNGDSRLQ
ncbi:MAG: DUF3990 domain-containing protein [Lachnospiraceae bacterium]|nr:DUF3990 domain-containing protein [Lachnospiraceae bacterium]